MDNDHGLIGEALGINTANELIVGHIAQIDNHLANIIVSALGLGKQRLYVLEHALGLLYDIASMQNLALVVD